MTECSRGVDFLALVFAGIGFIVLVFLLRIAGRPRTNHEEEGALGNKIAAGVIALITLLLLYKGIAAEGPTDLATCARETV